MKRVADRSLAWGVALGALLGLGGCERDAFVVVQLSGDRDTRTQFYSLYATTSEHQASEVYQGQPAELDFFLPAGSLDGPVSVQIEAWGATCVLATGSAMGQVENRPRLDLAVELAPVQGCP